MKKLAIIALLLSGCATNVTARPATRQELKNFFRSAYKVCPDGTKVKSFKSCPIVTPTPTPTPTPVPVPPPPPTQICWDGSIILLTAICPPVPPPVPPPPPPAPPVFSVQDVTVNEANSTATIPVLATGANGSPSTLTYTTTSGTATAGSDFVAVSGTLTIPDGVTLTNISVPIIDDTVVEGTETFNVTITPVTNATAGKPVGIVTILDNDVAAPPPPPPPPPPSGYVTATTLLGLAPITDNFDFNTAIQAGVAASQDFAPEPGAFRFICSFDKLLPDDPVVYPGQPGRSHEHGFYGNEGINAYSTFSSLRTTGGSSCNAFGDGTTAANRSGYWIPAMDDGKGHYIQPDYNVIYYKRLPKTDPKMSDPTASGYEGQAEPIPNGLRYIFGYNMATATAPPPGVMWFNCQGPTATPGHYPDIPSVAAFCPAGAGNQLGFVIIAYDCWDGQYVDTPDHRSHMSYSGYGYWGYLKCDAQHPYVIPTLTLGIWYTVAAGDDLTLWHFSSDEMHPELAHGLTGHADYFEAWSNPVKQMWEDNCINKRLSCNSGNLGNGFGLKGTAAPTYIIGGVPVELWSNPNRIVNK